MWQILGNNSFDLREVSSIHLLEENGHERVVILMKNQKEINVVAEDNVTPTLAYESLTNLIKAMHERDNRFENNKIELLKRISSELKLVSQNLRRL